MKKVLLGIICLLSFSFLTVKAAELPEKTDHEIVTIYIFRGSGCSHCYEALEFFNGFFEANPDYSDYIQVKAYEVWNNEDNSTLLNNVAAEFDEEIGGVPYIVVGDAYHAAGFAEDMGTEIIDTALAEYENEDYEDVVARVAEDENPEAVNTSLEEAAIEEGIVVTSDYKKEDNGSDTWIIIGIFAVVAGGIVALVALSRKNN